MLLKIICKFFFSQLIFGFLIFMFFFCCLRLMLTLYIPLLNEEEKMNICSFPMLSNNVPVFVTSVEKENIIYSQHQDSVNILDKLLDEMFGFYEKRGEFFFCFNFFKCLSYCEGSKRQSCDRKKTLRKGQGMRKNFFS